MEVSACEAVLPFVQKPGRYIGKEWNAIRKDHAAVEVRVALCYPDVYEVGMSHLGLKIIYHELNKRDDTLAERVFAPWVDMEEEMRARRIPLWALESRQPVARFDIVGFTLQYELGYTNILNMLDLAGIPLRAAERRQEDPFVIGGGPCAYSPEPLAPFFDLFVLGDGEEVVHDVVDAFKGWRKRVGKRAEFLREAASIPGVYVPSLYEAEYDGAGALVCTKARQPDIPPRVTKRVVRDLGAVDYPTKPVVPLAGAVHDRAVLEIFRGCTRGCRFCQAGVVYRPVRERSPEQIRELARELVHSTGYGEISLASLSSTDYSRIVEVVKTLGEEHARAAVGLSLPSLRTDAFSVSIAREIQRVRKGGLTFAPEAGTQRLRQVINKGVTEEDLFGAARAALEAGWTGLKLYFMIGLPTETREDLDGIVELVSGLRALHKEVRGRGGGKLRLTVSLSSFVPKAHTPFQWEPQEQRESLKKKQGYLRARLAGHHVEVDWHDADMSFIEAVFSRGDRRLAGALQRAWDGGCRFDAWSEQFSVGRWLAAFARAGVDPGWYANRRRPHDEVLPWDHIDPGVDKCFLLEEQRRAMRGETTPDCRYGCCVGCGACEALGVSTVLQGGGPSCKG